MVGCGGEWKFVVVWVLVIDKVILFVCEMIYYLGFVLGRCGIVDCFYVLFEFFCL